MKNISRILVALFSVIALNGCLVDLDLDDDLPCVTGSGNMVSENRNVARFDKIQVFGNAEVFITQGNRTSIEVYAEDNIIRRVATRVAGSSLQIDVQGCISRYRTVQVNIVTPDIRSISVSGSADVIVENTIEANTLDFDISGSGNIYASLDARETAVRISGSGDIFLDGEVDFQDVYITGSGGYESEDLFSRDAEVVISGSGNAYVYVRNRLDATIIGSGNIYYRGDPDDVRTRITGSGNIIKD